MKRKTMMLSSILAASIALAATATTPDVPKPTNEKRRKKRTHPVSPLGSKHDNGRN